MASSLSALWAETSRAWTSGRWSAELRGDEIADLAVDGAVVLRSVRAVVRDRDWDTAALTVDEVIEREGGLTIRVHTRELGADLTGQVRVDAAGDTVTVALDLRAAADFETNRTGLVVLHPATLAGAAMRIDHTDGSSEASAFPVRISPHQPAFDIAGLSWEGRGGDVALRFHGDVFEMEDQRNWTDASFKTYSRPLSLPFPYRLAEGETVSQAVTVSVTSGPGESARPDRDVVMLGDPVRMPLLAVSASTAPDPAPQLPAIPWAASLVELDLASPTWRAALDRAAASDRPLDVRFILADAEPLLIEAAAGELAGLDLARVTAFWPTGDARLVSDTAAVALVRAALRDAGITAFLAGGVRSHFTELNREQHRLPEGLDGIVFSSTPLFHSLSTAQLTEAVAMQRLVAEQTVEIAGGGAVHIGPISLRPHVNDVATTPPPMSAHGDLRDGYGPALLDAADPRMDAPELAAWTLASAAAFTAPGVATLAYFEEWGPRGVFRADGSSRPVTEAIEMLAALQGRVVATGGTADGLVWAIRDVEAGEVVVANLDAADRVVRVGDAAVTVPALSWRRTAAS
ncbi:hypothetical protein [Microbacterium luteum]|uniref:hypothetical protein n=1 Tax=Microbacterium TaxID=33882 RepID=UPI00188976E0|nr:hypothetical protein [Microbacterium luteum]